MRQFARNRAISRLYMLISPEMADRAFRGELAKDSVTASKVEAGGRTRRTAPVDESRTIRRHDHVAGVKVAMAQPVPRRQALDQGEDASGDVLRKPVGEPRRAGHRVAQGEYVRWRGC